MLNDECSIDIYMISCLKGILFGISCLKGILFGNFSVNIKRLLKSLPRVIQAMV